MKSPPLLLIITLTGLISSCSESPSDSGNVSSPKSETIIQTVNYPLFYFADRLSGDQFNVRYIVDREGDPAFWEPSDDAIQAFQKADLIIKNGAGYANWMKRVSLPSGKMLDTSADFSKQFIPTSGGAHQHGDGETHQHGDFAFTTWLDFTLAAKQAQSIAGQLAAISPESGEQIQKDLEKLQNEIQTLDEQMMAWAKKWGRKPLLASHPVYQYWAKRYNLNVKSLHWEPDTEWDAAREKELTEINTEHQAQWIIWEGAPDPKLIATLKGKGIQSVVFDPCGNHPGKENDWLAVMKANIAALEKAMP